MAKRIIKKESQFSLLQKMTLFLLILAGMNFLSRDRLIGFIACVLFLVIKGRFVINGDFLTLTLLSVSWVIFAPSDGNAIFETIKAFVFPFACCVGLNFLPADDQERAEKNYHTAIVAIAVGPFIHFILNFLYNFGRNIERNTNDFWTGDTLAATIQAILSLMMLVVAITTLFSNAPMRKKILSVVTLVAIFIYNLVLAGRTLFVMLLIIFGASLLFLMFKGEKKSTKYRTLLVIIILILVFALLYNANVFNIQDTIESSNLYDRFFGQTAQELDEDSRMDRKLSYLENFGKSLWGGVHLRPLFGHAHDILLDTYDEAGIFALLAMILFLISAVIRLFSCLQNRFLKFQTKQLILAMYVAILVQFMVEPILQGVPWLFMLFCFIHGMTTGLDRLSRRSAESISP